jgi:solute carrier family 6 GABA transporter-like protein 1
MPALAGILSKLKPTVNREKDGREQFPNRVAFILAAIGGAVGLGNVLRYPSVVFANSGLQWFIPYLIALLFLGIPVLLLEISLGQAYRAGVVTSFNSLHNRTKGVGLGVVLTGYMVVCYYVPILAWIMHYFRGSFQSPLPWGDDPDAYFMGQVIANTDPLEGTIEGGRVTQYTDYPGMGMVGETAGWCAFIWVCVWLSLFSGISLTGRAVYFTMGFPIVMIFVLLGRSASLERAGEGVKYYFGEWHSDKLAGGQIWQGACGQIFFSIGVGFGYFTTYASYNPRFANAVQDTLIIACSNSMFEIVAGFVVFSIIGFLEMTPEKDGQDLSTFVVGFLTYPAALSEMPGANFFAVIWFLTIACLGVSSSVALTETMVTMIHESSVGSRHPRWMIATGVIVVSFLLSLMYCSKFGFYLLDAVDTWVNNLTLLMIVLCEIVSVATMYRWSDVVSQVGMVAYLTSCISYIFSLIIGVAVGQAVSPEAGAGVGFGIFGIGQVASVLLSKTPDSIAPAFFGKNGFIAKFWWLNFYTVYISIPSSL